VKTPTATPEPPKPAMARPTIRVVGSWATPQTKLPSSKMSMAMRNQSFKGKYLNSFPQVDWKPVCVREAVGGYVGGAGSGSYALYRSVIWIWRYW